MQTHETSMSLRDSLLPFFGDSEKAERFFKANYRGRFDVALNKSSPGSLTHHLMYNMMLCKNYTNKLQNMKDNDVHFEFFDFLAVYLPLYHRLLDQQSGLGQYENMLQDMATKLNTVLNYKLNNSWFNGPMANVHNTQFNVMTNIYTTQPILTLATNTYLLMSHMFNSQLQNLSFFQWLCVNLLVPLNFITTDQQLQNYSNFLNVNITYNGSTQKVNQFLYFLAGFCDASNPTQYNAQSQVSNFCIGLVFNSTNGSRNFETFLSSLSPTDKQTYLNGLNTKINDALIGLLNALYNGLRITSVADIQNAKSNWQAFVTMFNNVVSDVNLKKYFMENLMNEIRELTRTSLLSYQVNRPKLQSNEQFEFCDNVLNRWTSLDRNARQFYYSQMQVFRNSPGPQPRNVVNLLDRMNMDNKCCNSYCQTPSDLRLNFKKSRPGSDVLLFASTLPSLPLDSIDGVWFTDVNGQHMRIPKEELTADLLEKVYMQVYTGKQPVSLNNMQLNLPRDLSNSRYVNYAKSNWSLSLSGCLKNDIMMTQKQQYQQKDTCEFLDLNNNAVWKNDDKGTYRMVNGQPQYFNMNDDIKCGTSIPLNLPDQECEVLAQCLLCNQSGLTTCLAKYQNYDMFNVAKSELEKMHPSVVDKLLAVFNVDINTRMEPNEDGTSRSVKVPENYEKWFNKLMDKSYVSKNLTFEFKDFVLKNNQILDYVKGLIHFVRVNKVLLNPDLKVGTNTGHSTELQEMSKLFENSGYGYKIYEYAGRGASDKDVYNAGFLYNNVVAFQPLPLLPTPFANAFVGGGYMSNTNLINSMGGGSCTVQDKYMIDADNLMTKINSKIESLQSKGKVLSEKDKNYIKNVNEMYKKSLQNVYTLGGLISHFDEISSAMDCQDGTDNNYGKNIEYSLSALNDNKSVLNYLRQNLGDCFLARQQNLNRCNESCVKLMKLYKDLVCDVSVR